MRTNVATRSIESGDLAAVGSFSIKATGKAFKILSDGLYSDKPLAIIRELSCNAFDAHVAAGRKDVPFEVHLPNVLEPHFSVKDFGTGLDHDDVMKLYTTYFESTKTDSNDFIGALGLGSKSPFSYVDSFTVTSRFNGMVRTYAAYLGEAGVPSIALMSEEPTSEPNGLEVSMPVKQQDFSVFADRAVKVLKRFKPVPVINIEITPPTYLIEGTGWSIRASEGYSAGKVFAIQGNVVYPIDKNALYGHLSHEQDSLFGLELDLFFDIGELEVAASREALQYDARTIANIKARLDKVWAEVPGHFSHHFANCSTLWEAKLHYFKLSRGFNTTLSNILSKSLVWNGQNIGDLYQEVDLRNLKPTTVICSINGGYSLRRKKLPISWDRSLAFRVDDGVVFYWDDGTVKKGFQRRLKYDFATRQGLDHAIIIQTKDELQTVLDRLGNPPYLRISDLEEPPPEPRTRNPSNLKQVYEYRNGSWHGVTHDVTQGGVFVNLQRWDVMWNGKQVYNFSQFVADATALGLYDGQIFGIPATYKNVPVTNKGWVEFMPMLRERAQEKVEKSTQLARRRANQHMLVNTSNEHLVKIIDRVAEKNLVIKRKSKPLGKLTTALTKLRAQVVDEDVTNALFRLIDRFNLTKVKSRKPDIDLKPLIEAAKAAYPLLEECHVWNDRLFDEWINYVNMKDASK